MSRLRLLAVMLLLAAPGAAQARTGFSFVLTGGAQLPPVITEASGAGIAVLSESADTLTISFQFAGLTGDYAASHVHGPGTSAQSAGLRLTLSPTLHPGARSGVCDVSWVLQPIERTWLMDGLLYVNVHSQFALNGEIRGQILADVTPVRRTTFGRLRQLYR